MAKRQPKRDSKGRLLPGEYPAGAGRPKGRAKPRSKLRDTLRKLQEMEQGALDNIKDSIDKKDIDKETVATSKWLITTIVSVNRAASADEQVALTTRIHEDEKQFRERELQLKKEGTNDNVIPMRFSTKMLEDEDEEEDDE